MQLVALVNKIAAVVALILLLVQELAGTAANTLQLVQDFINANRGIAVEVHPYTIDTNVNTILLDVTNGSSGLLAMSDKLDALLAAQTDALAYLTAKLDLLHNQPVKLPPIAPDGYGGGGSSGATASDVWNYVAVAEDRPMGYWLLNAGKLALNVGNANVQFASQGSPLIGVTAFWNQHGPEIRGESPPTPDLNAIGSYSTVLEWLVGTSGRDDWTLNPQGYYWCEADLSETAFSFFVCTISQADFDHLKETAPSAVLVGAPVWPGLANVTLGAVLTLTDGMTVDGPLDGVIINISAVPPPTGFYGFGARKSYVHIGAIVFISDNGDAEHSETIGLDSQVISVRGMTRAASAVLRVKSGTVGTVQPWTTTA